MRLKIFNAFLLSILLFSLAEVYAVDNGTVIGVSGMPTAFLLSNSGETKVVVGAQPLAELQRVVDELTNGASNQ